MEYIDETTVVMSVVMLGKVIEPVELPARIFTSDSGVLVLLKLDPECEVIVKKKLGEYSYKYKREKI
jgi:hypothetical protein